MENVVRESTAQCTKSIREYQYDSATTALDDAIRLQRVIECLSNISASLATEASSVHLIESKTLHDAYNYLTSSAYESILVGAAIQLDNVTFITRIIPLDLADSSMSFARAAAKSISAVQGQMFTFGNVLGMHFHAHPGDGVGWCQPSGIDTELQQSYEGGDTPTIGAIFSRDRYVRFYTVKREFSIQVCGKEVTRIDENTFRLSEQVDTQVSGFEG